jgi:hypothetical protein
MAWHDALIKDCRELCGAAESSSFSPGAHGREVPVASLNRSLRRNVVQHVAQPIVPEAPELCLRRQYFDVVDGREGVIGEPQGPHRAGKQVNHDHLLDSGVQVCSNLGRGPVTVLVGSRLALGDFTDRRLPTAPSFALFCHDASDPRPATGSRAL